MIGGSDAEIAVGAEDDPVDSPLDKVVTCDRVGQPNAFTAVARAARCKDDLRLRG